MKSLGMYRGGVGGTGNRKVADVWMIDEYLSALIIDRYLYVNMCK